MARLYDIKETIAQGSKSANSSRVRLQRLSRSQEDSREDRQARGHQIAGLGLGVVEKQADQICK